MDESKQQRQGERLLIAPYLMRSHLRGERFTCTRMSNNVCLDATEGAISDGMRAVILRINFLNYNVHTHTELLLVIGSYLIVSNSGLHCY